MSITIYYLRRYGLSYSLAKTLAADKVELLDLFLVKNLKLSKLYAKNKYGVNGIIRKIKNIFA